MDVINRVIPNAQTELPLSSRFLDKLDFYKKDGSRWYLKSFDSEGDEKLVFSEQSGNKKPEEVVRQLFIYELIHEYGYPAERIKIEKQVKFGREKKRADVIVYQNDNDTPLIIAEIKAPDKKNDIQQMKSYLNAEGSPLGVGFNGKNISRYIRPYPKEFETLRDLPTEDEYQMATNSENLIRKLKELINNRKWTLDELNEINKDRQYNLREIIEELEELVLANSGEDSFEEIFKLIYSKLFDEFEAVHRENKTLHFRDYSDPEITYKRISSLFEEAKKEWRDVFQASERIKLSPENLEVIVGRLTEVKLFGTNLRIIDEAFEHLVTDVAKRKKGQYFTPRVIIDACVEMVEPKRKEYILDPACGSAGFLLHAMKYIWDEYNLEEYKQRSDYSNKYLWGIDLEEKTTKISRALMLIAGDGKSHIYKQNTLDYKKWDESFKSDLKKESLMEDNDQKSLKYDIVLSNPPFAGDVPHKRIINQYKDLLNRSYSYNLSYDNISKIVSGLEEDFELKFRSKSKKVIKDHFKKINKDPGIDLELQEDLDNVANDLVDLFNELIEEGNVAESILKPRIKESLKFNKNLSKWSSVDRHILFIQRIVEILKPGGRAIIVLPQGIFNNSNEKFIRDYLFDKARILGVVGLHGNSFKPHTGTKTSLLFIRKLSEEFSDSIPDDYPIFFASSKLSFKDNSGDYLYATDEEGNVILNEKGDPRYLTDLYDIVDAFKEWGKKQYENGDKSFEFLSN